MRIFRQLLIVSFALSTWQLVAQDDLLDVLEKEQQPIDQTVGYTWKGQRLVNGHTTKTRKAGEFEFIIMHRFGELSTGIENLFGLDYANIRFSFEYGITDQITLGIGRSSFEKTFDGFFKYSFLQQGKNSPVALTWFSSIATRSLDNPNFSENDFTAKTVYTHELLIAQKISEKVSLLLIPVYVHRNRVMSDQVNDMLALGFGGRLKLNQRMALISEYYWRITKEESQAYYDSFGVGLEVETGGHVFQLTFSNSRSMIEKGFITETKGDFFDGDIHFGFNLSRTF